MALDGITIASIVNELNQKILGGRIDKVNQPEQDEIVIPIRSMGKNHKLLLTASASHPRIHLTDAVKNNPMQAPMFCMVLRKHLNGGKITSIRQPDFERIIELHIESMNEMGDMSTKRLIIEIMGKHSNIILVNDQNIIIDSAKRISHDKSSVREVLPGKAYFVPRQADKQSPLLLDDSFFDILIKKKNQKLQTVIYQSYNGISPVMAGEICNRAGINPDDCPEMLLEENVKAVYTAFLNVMADVKVNAFQSQIYKNDKNKAIDFSCIEMSVMKHFQKEVYESPSDMLTHYYSERDTTYRVAQKTVDLRKLVQTHLERCVKKKEMQNKTMIEIKDRDSLRVYGELITAHIHSISKGMTSYTTQNFYDENLPEITIPLDANLTASENAQKYFKKYNKEKRTYAALIEQTKQNESELSYLDGVLSAIQSAQDESDIEEIREELYEQGYVKKRKASKKQMQKKSKPLHYVSSEGFDMYVGKNNKQNDELTLKFAINADIWMHTKEIPGSHVIIRTEGKEPGKDTLAEGALLAAFYSRAKDSSQVPVDYTHKKNVKKPSGAKPGMVIYERNKTIYVTPDENEIKRLTTVK